MYARRTQGHRGHGISGGDLDELIERHLPLVEHQVLRLSSGFPRYVDRNELISAGTLGLVEAARRYDPATGVPFANFASRRIRGAILDLVRSHDWAPRSVRSLNRRVEAAEQVLASRHGVRPDDEAVALEAGIDVDRLVELRGRVRRSVLVALDHSSGDLDGGGVASRLADRAAATPDEGVEAAELRGYVRDALRQLPERHRIVAAGLYLEGCSFDELAELLDVTPSRVSQLRSEAVEMMRDGVAAQYRMAPAAAPVGRVARRKASYAAAIARSSTWRDRLSDDPDRVLRSA